jgi:hypothetical protein
LSEGQTQVNQPFPAFPDSLLTVAKRLYRVAAPDLAPFGELPTMADPARKKDCNKRVSGDLGFRYCRCEHIWLEITQPGFWTVRTTC